jgi:DNA repair protein RadC
MAIVKSKAVAAIIGEKQARRLPQSITDIRSLTVEDMIERGVTRTNAFRLMSCFALCREIAGVYESAAEIISGSAAAVRYVRSRFPDLQHAQQEEMWVVTLNTKHKPIAHYRVGVGTLRNCLVHPREVFAPAIADHANSILMIHNHPSGDPTPSDHDIAVTQRMDQAGEVVGIAVVDHIVAAGQNFTSIRDFQSCT